MKVSIGMVGCERDADLIGHDQITFLGFPEMLILASMSIAKINRTQTEGTVVNRKPTSCLLYDDGFTELLCRLKITLYSRLLGCKTYLSLCHPHHKLKKPSQPPLIGIAKTTLTKTNLTPRPDILRPSDDQVRPCEAQNQVNAESARNISVNRTAPIQQH